MASRFPVDAARKRAVNASLRQVGLGATVELTYPPTRSDLARVGTVVARGRFPGWMWRDPVDGERPLVLDMGGDAPCALIAFAPRKADRVPRLNKEERPGIGVWDVTVVERGVQVAADTCAADLFAEVGRYGGP